MTIAYIIQKYKEHKWLILLTLSVTIFIIILLLFFYSGSEKEGLDEMQLEELISNEETTSEDEKEVTVIEEENTHVIIDVKGAVNFPGVYELNGTHRVIDAIERAGGLLENSDTRNLNFAKQLVDEMSIYIPVMGEDMSEVITEIENDTVKEVINLNTANVSELTQLNGIGPKKAEEIIRHRENENQFEKIEDIMIISGIGEKTFEKIKESIRVK